MGRIIYPISAFSLVSTDNFIIFILMTVSHRKKEHIDISLNHEVSFREKTTGFERFEFIHCALPELNLDEVSTGIEFLGKQLSFPMLISAMTGGYEGAYEINRILAETARTKKLALAIGSQRQAINEDNHLESYRIVRKTAPDALIIGNIGAEEIAGHKDSGPFRKLVDLIEADALAVHLNPLQEILQPEGSGHFSGVLKGIETLVKTLEVPVIVKEIGCGISENVAWRLKNAGVRIVDIAGAGGTSWAGIEYHRGANSKLAQSFWDWGIPTADSLQMVSRISDLQIIASGGITGGKVMAKSLALGASLCGTARPLLRILESEGIDGLNRTMDDWKEELKITLFLTGCGTVSELSRKNVLYRPGAGACDFASMG